MAEYRINYPIVMVTPELQALFPGVHGLPTTFVLDHDLRVVKEHLGYSTPVWWSRKSACSRAS